MPNNHSNVFGCGVEVFKIVDIFIQIFMVKPVNYKRLDKVAQMFHIHHITRFGVNGSGNVYNQVVVVPVVSWVVAFPKNGLILGLAPVRVVQPVGGVEMLFAGNSNLHQT